MIGMDRTKELRMLQIPRANMFMLASIGLPRATRFICTLMTSRPWGYKGFCHNSNDTFVLKSAIMWRAGVNIKQRLRDVIYEWPRHMRGCLDVKQFRTIFEPLPHNMGRALSSLGSIISYFSSLN